jgi:hypothetical protein
MCRELRSAILRGPIVSADVMLKAMERHSEYCFRARFKLAVLGAEGGQTALLRAKKGWGGKQTGDVGADAAP